jgi:ribosomal protein S18 acetylase RimI-like enzyme
MTEPHFAADPWLSKQLSKAAFHLAGNTERLAKCMAPLSARLAQGVPFADAKISVDDVGAAAALQTLGFKLIDTNLQFDLAPASLPSVDVSAVSFASKDDTDAVASIAERSFSFDRFHRDPAVSAATANALKRAWARSFFEGGRGDWMVTARVNSVVAGFLQLIKTGDGKLVIDLIAVDRERRGHGLARAMIAYASIHCDPSLALVVGTQVSNIPSVRLYESMGFRLERAQYVYHRHEGAAC